MCFLACSSLPGVSWNKLTFVILPGYTVVDTDRLYYDNSIRGYSAVIRNKKNMH